MQRESVEISVAAAEAADRPACPKLHGAAVSHSIVPLPLRPRPLEISTRTERAVVRWAVVLGVITLVLLLFEMVERVEHFAWVDFVMDRDWPMLLALVASVWIARVGLRDARTLGHDASARIGRAAGVGLVSTGEMLAYFLAFFHQAPWVGHFVAVLGAVLTAVTTVAITWRRRWVERVRAGDVPGWAIRSLEPAERPPGLLPYVAPRRHELESVLFRVAAPLESYRTSSQDVPVALVGEMPERGHWL